MNTDSAYRKMYLSLFNAVSRALELLEGGRAEEARRLLLLSQQDCEELYISAGDRAEKIERPK